MLHRKWVVGKANMAGKLRGSMAESGSRAAVNVSICLLRLAVSPRISHSRYSAALANAAASSFPIAGCRLAASIPR